MKSLNRIQRVKIHTSTTDAIKMKYVLKTINFDSYISPYKYIYYKQVIKLKIIKRYELEKTKNSEDLKGTVYKN